MRTNVPRPSYLVPREGEVLFRGTRDKGLGTMSMKGRKTFILIFAVLLAVPALLFAADPNAGTSGAQFLKIGVGARPVAMGESFVGVADDVNAVYYNPSGLAFIDRPELTAQRTQWFQGVDHQFGAFAYPTDYGAFALSATTLKVEDIQKRGADESYEGNFQAMDSAYAFSYARMLGPLSSVGITGRYFKEEIDAYSASAWGGDVGFLRKFVAYPVSVGLAVRDFGQKIKFRNEEDPQPLTIDLGMGANLFNYRLLLAANVAKSNDSGYRFGLGTEYSPVLTKSFRFTLRGGFNTAQTDGSGAPGISAGAGIGIRQLSFDFAWVPFGDLGNTFRYSLGFRF